jgi:4-hydroxybenzoate decarboxylase
LTRLLRARYKESGTAMPTPLCSSDLRTYLSQLEAEQRLLRVRREVDAKFELAAVTKRIQQTSNLPVVFERVRGTAFPVVSNLYGHYGLVARLLGTDVSGVAARWAALMADTGAAPAGTAPGAPPAVRSISLLDVPHLTYCEKDAGPYLTASVVLARDPDSGAPNLSYHRMQMVGDDELRARLSPAGDLFRMQQKAEATGQALEVAVLVGAPPAVNLAGAAAIAAGSSELDLADRIAGARLPTRRCQSVDLEVPAQAEFVIEGEILPGVRRPEGPFGEWQDYYVPVMDNHVLRVRHVTAREGALFHAILSGSTEELTLSAIPNAALIYRAIRAFDPSVRDVVCYPWPQFCVVQITKRYEGQAQKAMLGAMGAETNRLLYCVVVDDDVDPHDLRDVLWAMATRCRPDRDVMQIPNVPSFARDPHRIHWGRLGIDATAPLEWPSEFERKRYPGLESIRLDDYLSPEGSSP